jgi:hypothetical protein
VSEPESPNISVGAWRGQAEQQHPVFPIISVGVWGGGDSLNNKTLGFPISVWVSGERGQPKQHPEFPSISVGVWGEGTA